MLLELKYAHTRLLNSKFFTDEMIPSMRNQFSSKFQSIGRYLCLLIFVSFCATECFAQTFIRTIRVGSVGYFSRTASIQGDSDGIVKLEKDSNPSGLSFTLRENDGTPVTSISVETAPLGMTIKDVDSNLVGQVTQKESGEWVFLDHTGQPIAVEDPESEPNFLRFKNLKTNMISVEIDILKNKVDIHIYDSTSLLFPMALVAYQLKTSTPFFMNKKVLGAAGIASVAFLASYLWNASFPVQSVDLPQEGQVAMGPTDTQLSYRSWARLPFLYAFYPGWVHVSQPPVQMDQGLRDFVNGTPKKSFWKQSSPSPYQLSSFLNLSKIDLEGIHRLIEMGTIRDISTQELEYLKSNQKNPRLAGLYEHTLLKLDSEGITLDGQPLHKKTAASSLQDYFRDIVDLKASSPARLQRILSQYQLNTVTKGLSINPNFTSSGVELTSDAEKDTFLQKMTSQNKTADLLLDLFDERFPSLNPLRATDPRYVDPALLLNGEAATISPNNARNYLSTMVKNALNTQGDPIAAKELSYAILAVVDDALQSPQPAKNKKIQDAIVGFVFASARCASGNNQGVLRMSYSLLKGKAAFPDDPKLSIRYAYDNVREEQFQDTTGYIGDRETPGTDAVSRSWLSSELKVAKGGRIQGFMWGLYYPGVDYQLARNRPATGLRDPSDPDSSELHRRQTPSAFRDSIKYHFFYGKTSSSSTSQQASANLSEPELEEARTVPALTANRVVEAALSAILHGSTNSIANVASAYQADFKALMEEKGVVSMREFDAYFTDAAAAGRFYEETIQVAPDTDEEAFDLVSNSSEGAKRSFYVTDHLLVSYDDGNGHTFLIPTDLGLRKLVIYLEMLSPTQSLPKLFVKR